MRVVHGLTYISSDGAFGGPASVVKNVAEEQARRGHHVTIVAGWDGVATFDVPGVRVELVRVGQMVPGAGFSGLWSPALLRRSVAVLRGADVAHVHLGRDLVTMTIARQAIRLGTRLVLQPHGMVMPDARLRSRLLDRIATCHVLRSASAVLALTDGEEDDLRSLGVTSRQCRRVGNGVSVGPSRAGGGNAEPPEVLFLARLHPRKRVLAFAQVAKELSAAGARARWRIVGPDEGDLPALLDFIETERLTSIVVYEGALPPERVRARLREADLYVLPAVNEVFPMSVLEAMAEGVPVVLTSSCGISDRLSRADAAEISEPDVRSLARSVGRLLDDPPTRDLLGARGQRFVAHELSLAAVVNEMDAVYRLALQRGSVSRLYC